MLNSCIGKVYQVYTCIENTGGYKELNYIVSSHRKTKLAAAIPIQHPDVYSEADYLHRFCTVY